MNGILHVSIRSKLSFVSRSNNSWCCDPNDEDSCPPDNSGGSGGGDAHFVAFNQEHWSWHGAYTVVLSRRSRDLAIEVHVRTTRVETKQIKYSYISNVAAKKLFCSAIILNGDKIPALSSFDDASALSFSGYNLAKSFKGTKKHIIAYDFDLGGEKSLQIRANLKSGILDVDLVGHYHLVEMESLITPTESRITPLPRAGLQRTPSTWECSRQEMPDRPVVKKPNIVQQDRTTVRLLRFPEIDHLDSHY